MANRPLQGFNPLTKVYWKIRVFLHFILLAFGSPGHFSVLIGSKNGRPLGFHAVSRGMVGIWIHYLSGIGGGLTSFYKIDLCVSKPHQPGRLRTVLDCAHLESGKRSFRYFCFLYEEIKANSFQIVYTSRFYRFF